MKEIYCIQFVLNILTHLYICLTALAINFKILT